MKKLELYTSNWCTACKSVYPIIQSLENVDVEIIDVEKETDRAVSLGIRNIPVVRILDGNGEQIQRLVGKEEILSYLK